MIPVLIILYLGKNKKQLAARYAGLFSQVSAAFKILLLLTACIFFGKAALAQARHYQYDIKKGGDRIGEINITHSVSGPVSSLQLVSDIRYRFIFLFTAKSKEEVVFMNGIMTYSSIYREQDGDIKIWAKTRKTLYSYVVERDNKKHELNIPDVHGHTIGLYIAEPNGQQKVYSDKYQQLVTVEPVSAHRYKIRFPDGNYNEYFYQDGICKTIKVCQSLFSATIELKKAF